VTGAPLLEVEDLRISFPGRDGEVPAVRGVDLRVRAGETVALVGESGCGKTVTALSLLRLLDARARVTARRLRFAGEDLLELDAGRLRALRGGRIGMIFQEPMTSLNPVFRIGDQIAEVLELHLGLASAQARREGVALLARVGIPAPERRYDQYPHELSGGMKQRVMIAMALACRPALLVADEPTTALDVTIQAQILELLARLRAELGMAILLITHDLGVVAQFAERVAVMYAGKVVEEADVRGLFRSPAHPYTRALLHALPRPGVRGRLAAIEGSVPNPQELPAGCAFALRCPERLARCAAEDPGFGPAGPGHGAACWLLREAS
jgi:oligopeptide/dipeptide ABC transporter ATP-binding protein